MVLYVQQRPLHGGIRSPLYVSLISDVMHHHFGHQLSQKKNTKEWSKLLFVMEPKMYALWNAPYIGYLGKIREHVILMNGWRLSSITCDVYSLCTWSYITCNRYNNSMTKWIAGQYRWWLKNKNRTKKGLIYYIIISHSISIISIINISAFV